MSGYNVSHLNLKGTPEIETDKAEHQVSRYDWRRQRQHEQPEGEKNKKQNMSTLETLVKVVVFSHASFNQTKVSVGIFRDQEFSKLGQRGSWGVGEMLISC